MMAKASIDVILDKVDWKPTGQTASEGELVATHEGILTILGWDFRVYQLSDGQRVIDADDIEGFFTATGPLTD